jgi:hypothetical protein
MRRTLCTATVAVLMAVLAPPAAAELTSHADPVGDYEAPDITRITLDNRENYVVGRIRYADINVKITYESFVIRWEGVRGYVVFIDDYDEDGDYEAYLHWYIPGGTTHIKCPALENHRDVEKDLTSVRVPRNCLNKAHDHDAPDRIQAKAVTWRKNGGCSCEKDITDLTDFVDRG